MYPPVNALSINIPHMSLRKNSNGFQNRDLRVLRSEGFEYVKLTFLVFSKESPKWAHNT